MNELALFAGAGGGILGGILCGFRTVCAVEHDAYARDVLVARQNDGCLEAFPIWDDVCTFDGKPWQGAVDVVSGGFPCQDISAAGRGAGISGERSGLWGQMARIIGEVGPRFVLVENSPVLTSRGLGVVLGDLATLGYDARWGVLGAIHAGAPHKRERIWIVAYARGEGRREITGRAHADESENARRRPQNDNLARGAGPCWIPTANVADASGGRCGGPQGGQTEQPWRAEVISTSQAVANTENTEQERGRDGLGRRRGIALDDDGAGTQGTVWWLAEPDVGRVADGVAARVDRLKAIGNGQVPRCAATAWRMLVCDVNGK